MNKAEIIIQISTGGYLEHKIALWQIVKKTEPFLKRVKVCKVIMGWSCNRALYQEAVNFFKSYGVQTFLWLPVFSETGLLASGLGRLVDDTGHEAEKYGLAEGENFEFYCPNQQHNRSAFLNIYQEHFDGLGFDGVFLDKIRYASCANGLGGMFGCFCPECLKRYEQAGIQAAVLRQEMGQVRRGQGTYGSTVLGIKSYEKGKYTFENCLWERFFRQKAQYITEALGYITSYFRKKGMQVGMDTFAPHLAYFAGQDLQALAGLTDFLKPMMYGITQAPAGLLFETDCLIRETCRRDQKAAETAFYQAIGCKPPMNQRFDTDFAARELETMAGLKTLTYCGIEINRNQVAHASPDYIQSAMSAFENIAIQGYVLSWDFLSAAEENIRAVEEHFARKRGR